MNIRLRFPCRTLAVGSALFATLTFAPHASAQPAAGRGALSPPTRVPEGVAAHRDLAYVERGHERQVLDLFVPEKSAAPLPVIVWIHGGGWSSGDKSGCPPLRQGYTQAGYAVASLNYRLSQQATFPAQIEDCQAAIRWLRAHAKEYNLDPKRFGVWGSSAGAHLAALVGTSGNAKEFGKGPPADIPASVLCVVDFFGPTDFLQMDANQKVHGAMVHNQPDSPPSRLIGGLISDPANRAKVARANPLSYVTADDPPFLIIHGDQDPVAPHHQSIVLYEGLKTVGVPVRFHTVKGAGHGPGIGDPEIEKMCRDFLDRYLQGKNNDAAKWPVAMKTSSEAVASPGGKK